MFSELPWCSLCNGKCDINENGKIVCTDCQNIIGSVFDNFQQTKKTEHNNKCKFCNKESLVEDDVISSIVCVSCGKIQENVVVFDGADWNNYTGDRETGKDNSRVGWFDETNPYVSLGSTIKKGKYSNFKVKDENGKWVNRDLSRVNQIVNSCSKEKSFYEVIKKLDQLTYDNSFNQRTVDKAKLFWNQIFKKERIYRGGNRSGIIACCVLYACYENNIPIEREHIAEKMFITMDDMVKGEPIFKSVIQETRFKYVLQQPPNAKCRFSKFINSLGLPMNTNSKCNDIYNKLEEELSEISISSAIGGVIAFVVGVVLKRKTPSKKDIADCVGVSVPTITNSLKIIKRNQI